jgi:2',3'-cyclic-nucleotide 2'-phosphodiesterase (5'-nucleotidase family)
LTIDPKTHRLLDVKEELIDLWPDQVGEDNSIKKLVGGLQSQVGDGFKVVIATATKALLRGDLGEESGLGSWMADCYKDWAGTEVALQNGGGMRADIVAGPVTVRDIFNVMPFDNTMVKLKVEGRQLRTVLDHGVGGPPRPVNHRPASSASQTQYASWADGRSKDGRASCGRSRRPTKILKGPKC